MTKEIKSAKKFIQSYTSNKAMIKILTESLKYYDNITKSVEEEIACASVSHPAESDNIGAGRSNNISRKVENIALSIDSRISKLKSKRNELEEEIRALEYKCSIIDSFIVTRTTPEQKIIKIGLIEGKDKSIDEIITDLKKEQLFMCEVDYFRKLKIILTDFNKLLDLVIVYP